MEHKTLSAVERKEFKKGPARRLRMEGKIPAIVYGHDDPVHISVDHHEFSVKFKTISENTIIDLTVGKKTRQVLVKDFDQDILTGKLRHIDFFEIEMGKILKTKVPVHAHGNSIGVKEGGILVVKIEEMEVECLPKDLPAEIPVNIDHLEVGHSIHVGELEAIPGVKFLANEDDTVVICSHAKTEVEHVEEEEVEGEEVPEEEAEEEEEV